MFTPGDYLQRAAELEILAADAPDCALHAGYQKLAQAFRDLANATSVSQMQPNAEVVRHAVRMVAQPIPEAFWIYLSDAGLIPRGAPLPR